MSETAQDERLRDVVTAEVHRILAKRWVVFAYGILAGIFIAGLLREYGIGGVAAIVDYLMLTGIIIPIAAVLAIIVGGVLGAISMVVGDSTEGEP